VSSSRLSRSREGGRSSGRGRISPWLCAALLLSLTAPPQAAAQAEVCTSAVSNQRPVFFGLLDLSTIGQIEGFSLSDSGEVALIAESGVSSGKCLMVATRTTNVTVLCERSVDPTSQFTNLAGRPSINNNGAIAFSGIVSSISAVYIVEPNPQGGYAVFLVDFAPISNNSRPILNDAGQVVYRDDTFPVFPLADVINRWDPGPTPTLTAMVVTGQDIGSVQTFGMDDMGRVTVAGQLTGGGTGALLVEVPFGGGTRTISSAMHGPVESASVIGDTGGMLSHAFDTQELLYRTSYDGSPVSLTPVDPQTMRANPSASFTALDGCNIAFSGFQNEGYCLGGTNDRGVCSSMLDCPGTATCDLQCQLCVGGDRHGMPCDGDCTGAPFCSGAGFRDAIYRASQGTVARAFINDENALVNGIGESQCEPAMASGPVEVNSSFDMAHTLNTTAGSFLVLADAPGSLANPILPSSCGIACQFNMVPGIANVGAGGTPLFFDPDVAIGYDYAVEMGSNFASVTVPRTRTRCPVRVGSGKRSRPLSSTGGWSKGRPGAGSTTSTSASV
jgi:hypothetical protein